MRSINVTKIIIDLLYSYSSISSVNSISLYQSYNLYQNQCCAGIGVVFPDHLGQIIAALSQRIPLVQSVELAEAKAAPRALLFAKELSLFNVEIEGDCSRVITALTELGRSCTLFGHVTDDCKRLDATL